MPIHRDDERQRYRPRTPSGAFPYVLGVAAQRPGLRCCRLVGMNEHSLLVAPGIPGRCARNNNHGTSDAGH